MRKFLFRVENLLLFLPLVFIAVYFLFYRDTLVDFHLRDTMYVASPLLVLGPLFLILFVLYSFHFLLRIYRKGPTVFSRFHAVGTSLALVLIAIIVITNAADPINPLSPGVRAIILLGEMIVLLVMIMLQFFFIIYFFYRIVTRNPGR